MTPRWSYVLSWSAVAALALVVLPLLARNLLAIPVLAPLDPNEGWNAAHAIAAITGRVLYPPPGALMVNNYPPLSFYIVGALARARGDFVVAGRVIAMLAFLATAAGIVLVLRTFACGVRDIALAVLFFAAVMLVASDYVGMDDPQMLGHALQIAALAVLLRNRLVAAALLFAISLFIKHNLLAMPIAAAAWLAFQDRRAAGTFVLWGIAFTLAGLIGFQLSYGTGLFTQLTSVRLNSFANLGDGASRLWWAALPVAALLSLRDGNASLFASLYAGIALALGLLFSAGDGVDANAFFDLAIALSLALGLCGQRSIRPWLAAAAAPPLLVFLAFTFADNNFFFTRDFAVQSARDIAFLKSRPGPALCDQLSLCLWAGKAAEMDVFNVGEQILARARDPAPIAALIAGRSFGVLQLQDPGALGPQVAAAIAKNYRADHNDDNGFFLVPRERAVRPAP
jgi:hypothetical protein